MMKRHTNLLLLVTAVFAAFTLGFFMGRNYNASPVQISYPLSTEAAESTPSQLILQAPRTEVTEPVNVTVSTTLPADISDTLPDETTPPMESEVPAEPISTATAPVATNPPQTQETRETSPKDETAPPTEAPQTTEEILPATTEASKSGLININTASVAELMTLPGIGEVLSQRIVEYRKTYGPFPSVAALTNVSGIGEKRLAAIIHLVTV